MLLNGTVARLTWLVRAPRDQPFKSQGSSEAVASALADWISPSGTAYPTALQHTTNPPPPEERDGRAPTGQSGL